MAAQQQSVTRCDCGIINCVSETCVCLCHGGGASAARTYLKMQKDDVCEASSMAAGGGTSSPVTRQLKCSCDETECCATMGKTLAHFTQPPPASVTVSPSTASRFLPGLLEDAEKAGLPVLTWLRLPQNAAMLELQRRHDHFLIELANEVFVRGSITASELRSRFPNSKGYGNIFQSARDAGLHIVTDEKNIALRAVYCSCEGGCERTQTGNPYCDGP
jgi:hypothetical protein